MMSVRPVRSKEEEAWGEKVEGIIKQGKIRVWYILIPIVQKGRKRLSPSRVVHVRYGIVRREGVKFRDSGSKIERNIAKHQICHTLPEHSVGTSLWRPKIFIMIKNQNTIPFTVISHIICGTQYVSGEPNGYSFTFFFTFFLSPISVSFSKMENPRWLQLNLFFCCPHVSSQSTMLGILTYLMAPR